MDFTTFVLFVLLAVVLLSVARKLSGGGSSRAQPTARRMTRREQREQDAQVQKTLEQAIKALADPQCTQFNIDGGGWGPEHIDLIAEHVGPAFAVYWRQDALDPLKGLPGYRGGKIVIDRHPSMIQPLTGIPTENGRIIIDPTNEPAWLTLARADWEIIYDDALHPDGTIGIRYRRKRPQTAKSWWFDRE